MRLTLMNAVILAEDYEKVRDWWIETVGLQLLQEWTEKYHYAELAYDGKLVVGIASAAEMDTQPHTPRRNAVVPQLSIDDVPAFLEGLKAKGVRVPFGPAHSEDEGGFWYGAFEDVEGNAVWVVSLTAGA